MDRQIRDRVEQTRFIDTHEHLIEESQRLRFAPWPRQPCDDWAYLLFHYFSSDLASAGMSAADLERFLAPGEASEVKWRLAAPHWARTKHTGYGQAVRRTLRALYGEDDLTDDSVPRIAEKYRDLVRPGFYRTVLAEHARIEHCQVNSLEHIFCQTELPDLLRQDIGMPALATPPDPARIAREFGLPVAQTLEEHLSHIDTIFQRCAPKAVAVKNQCAYSRALRFDPVSRETAAPHFARLAAGEKLSPADQKELEDFLFRHCVGKAREYGLPVKLHTGYYAGHGRMPLERVRQNAGDLCPLLAEFPDTRFVLMHIGYPYQDEYIALAKHYPNVTIDLCWAWIINPAAGVRFVREFLLAAPANKLLTFGGDYVSVEPIVGHAQIARQGLAQALSELAEAHWIAREEALELIDPLMHGNARALFPAR